MRTILRTDAEAEDVMRETYVRAYQHLREFAWQNKFSTWLTKIAIYEALARMRRLVRDGVTNRAAEADLVLENTIRSNERDPEMQAYDRE